MNRNYQLGLLYLVHLLMSADGVVDENETQALNSIKSKEGISESIFDEFKEAIRTKRGREIYQTGIEYMNRCTDEEKLRAFVILYKMSEVDGRVHVKEVRLLLYCIKVSGIEFDDVVAKASISSI
ncbi:MAG TPA: TerB family tellurite resistance protein [Cyclobacteriaceae bacterium]|nr:TerB family tellurite resistance protein [Cyclobacteriaceae bacterium]HMV07815.1 TerB family tellurite resistance protein [Cyclobacteriaceae bacterium]HMV88083.1 TerB family tellurite resistance protein [Cyclobacteriaceae bacterium]HMW98949.1 TerB family tellurite resistance protein [Cyclobacteriaceae bacterium]HMX48417.1 TerB family tellurite resistance protein [Cyclobacteriaceae bacterium]